MPSPPMWLTRDKRSQHVPGVGLRQKQIKLNLLLD